MLWPDFYKKELNLCRREEGGGQGTVWRSGTESVLRERFPTAYLCLMAPGPNTNVS